MARITFTTMYDTTMRNLQRNANKLNNLDEQIASGRRINRPSDNPVGFSQSMGYTNSVNALRQHRVNMDDGQAYMNTLERTHQSMNGLFGNSRDLAVSASNDTMNHSERLIVHLDIRRNLEQLVALSQTRHKDSYIFSGTWTNQPPYEIKKGEVSFNRTMYNGIPNPNYNSFHRLSPGAVPVVPTPNPPPRVLLSGELNADYGYIYSPSNNNIYNNNAYDPLSGLDRTLPNTWPMFNTAVPIEIPLYDNNYLDLDKKTTPANLSTPDYPEAQRMIPGSFELGSFILNGKQINLVEKPGTNTDFSHLDFTPPLTEEEARLHPDYDKPDYEIDYAEGKLILLSDRAKAAFYNYDGTAKDPGDPRYHNEPRIIPNPDFDDLIDEDPITNPRSIPNPIYDPYFDRSLNPYGPPSMNFEYIYRNSNDMSGDIYREMEANQTMKVNMNPDTLFGKDGKGQTDSFKELIHLMQGLWYNEQHTIAEGIDTVEAARVRNLEQQTVTGSRQNRMDSVYDRNLDLSINELDAHNKVVSADLADVLTQFTLADAVYNASLYSASQMMRNNLMNYL